MSIPVSAPRHHRRRHVSSHRFFTSIRARPNASNIPSLFRTASQLYQNQRRTIALIQQLASLRESLDIPVRIRRNTSPLQRLDRVGGVRLFGPESPLPHTPPSPTIHADVEILPENLVSPPNFHDLYLSLFPEAPDRPLSPVYPEYFSQDEFTLSDE